MFISDIRSQTYTYVPFFPAYPRLRACRYIKKEAVVRVAMSEKRTEKEQKSISADITALKAKMEEEAAVHDEIVEYLKSAHAKLADKVTPPPLS